MAATHAELDRLRTPERLDRIRALHTQRMAEMRLLMDQRAEASETFYAVLSPVQQKVFDEQLRRATGHYGDHPMGRMPISKPCSQKANTAQAPVPTASVMAVRPAVPAV